MAEPDQPRCPTRQMSSREDLSTQGLSRRVESHPLIGIEGSGTASSPMQPSMKHSSFGQRLASASRSSIVAAAVAGVMLVAAAFATTTVLMVAEHRHRVHQLQHDVSSWRAMVVAQSQQLQALGQDLLHQQAPPASQQSTLATGFDAAEAMTSPTGRALINLAAAGHDVTQLQAQLAPVLAYKHSLPVRDLARSNVFVGNLARVRRVVRDLMAGGKEVRVGVVGGSISWGHGASNAPVTGWFGVLSSYLQSAFPRAKVIPRNGAIPATSCAYIYMCLEMSVDEDVDILFVEYLINDGFEDVVSKNARVKVLERLARKVLNKPRRPAVVLVQVLTQGSGYDPADSSVFRPFHVTLEDLYGAVAQYYDLPWLSLRTATWRYAVAPFSNDSSALSLFSFYDKDYRHPNDLGNKFMSDMIVHLLQTCALELLATRPWGPADQLDTAASLPEPMYPHNFAHDSRLCVHNQELKSYVRQAVGWELVAEGKDPSKPKWGFVAQQPGSTLVLQVDTRQPNAKPHQRVNLLLAYLKSYEHMGVAAISCLAGCSCRSQLVDAHQLQRESTTHLHSMLVTQAQNCSLGIAVVNETNSGEHKFKVSGIIMQDEAASDAGLKMGSGLWVEGRHHPDTMVG